MSETTVVNIRTDKFDVKCCRSPKGEILPPPHPSCVGNPYTMVNESQRDEVCDNYEAYFAKRIVEDLPFRQYVMSLRGKRLACFCSPLRCHVLTIKNYLDGLPD